MDAIATRFEVITSRLEAITTSNKKLLGTKGIATRSKVAYMGDKTHRTRGWPGHAQAIAPFFFVGKQWYPPSLC